MKWQKIFGGSTIDELVPPDKISLIDRDGGYLLATTTYSNDGDVSGNHKSIYGFSTYDIWVTKLDSQKVIKWAFSLGGSDSEGFGSLQLAHDSGYILTGYTNSNDGDVSGNHGQGDAWVVRLNERGNIIWQKCYGGTNADVGTYIEKTGDGYILLGSTRSNDGDVSGLHGITNDIWVAKLDKMGNLQWQKCLGGSGYDNGTALKQTPDGGFIITGVTSSNDGDVQGFHGTDDIWVVKISRNGSIEWQKCLGGTKEDYASDVDISPTGGYIIVGNTMSSNGDVTGHHLTDTSYDTSDAWVISLSPTGTIQWQKTFGGGQDDAFNDVQLLPDHNFLAVGETNSSDGDVSHLYGYEDCWMVKFNNAGDIVWENSFTNGGSIPIGYGVCCILRPNGNIIVGGFCRRNWSDIWLFEAGSINTIAGYVFYDANKDGIKNNNELFFDGATIRSTKNGQSTSTIPKNGYYKIDIDTGSYVTQALPNYPYYTPLPTTQSSLFTSFFNVDSVNFAIQPQPGILDINVSLFSYFLARPGFGVQYQLYYKNVGTDIVSSGSIKLVKDPRLSFLSATTIPTIISTDTITWNFNNFHPNTDSLININFLIATPPSVNIGDTLHSVAWVQQVGADATPIDDTISFKQIVTGGLDPNDKTEANAGIITPAQVTNGEYLNYLIRFQNKGTDTAFNITVRDTLEGRLDLSTLQMISASHTYQLSIENGNKLAWLFNDIKLPHEGVNDPGSHGYIAYRIKPLSSVHVGDTIKNSASIYFDYNLPIVTNTQKTIVFQLSAPLPVTLLSFKAFEAGPSINVSWITAMENNIHHYEIQRSANGVDYYTIGTIFSGNKKYLYKDNRPLIGYNYYRLKSVDYDGVLTYSTIALVNFKSDADIISLVYPNPSNGNVNLKLKGNLQDKITIQVLNTLGMGIYIKQFNAQQVNEFTAPLNLGTLTKGSYLLKIVIKDKVYLHQLLIQ